MRMLDFFRADPRLLLPVWLFLASLVLLAVMGADKRRARRGLRRVPEKTLFLLALLGGAWGGWLGMRLFRHKTKHRSFVLGFPLLALLQLALCAWLFLRQSALARQKPARCEKGLVFCLPSLYNTDDDSSNP